MSLWRGGPISNNLLWTSIYEMHPIMGVRMLPKDGFMIRNIGTKAECTMWLVAKVGNNTLDTLKVAKLGCSTITTESHDSMGNVH